MQIKYLTEKFLKDSGSLGLSFLMHNDAPMDDDLRHGDFAKDSPHHPPDQRPDATTHFAVCSESPGNLIDVKVAAAICSNGS